MDANPFKVKGEEETVYILGIQTDLNGKEVQKRGDICICTGFPGGSDGKESACNSGDLGLIPGSGRSPGEGNGDPFQQSCLENSMVKRSLVGYSPRCHKESDMTE